MTENVLQNQKPDTDTAFMAAVNNKIQSNNLYLVFEIKTIAFYNV